MWCKIAGNHKTSKLFFEAAQLCGRLFTRTTVTSTQNGAAVTMATLHITCEVREPFNSSHTTNQFRWITSICPCRVSTVDRFNVNTWADTFSWACRGNQKGWDRTVTSRTTTFTLAYTSRVKRAAAFTNYSGAPWLFWGYEFLQLGHKTDFIKLFVQPRHREAVTHKYLPQVVYNSATVSCTPISAAEYIHSIKEFRAQFSAAF